MGYNVEAKKPASPSSNATGKTASASDITAIAEREGLNPSTLSSLVNAKSKRQFNAALEKTQPSPERAEKYRAAVAEVKEQKAKADAAEVAKLATEDKGILADESGGMKNPVLTWAQQLERFLRRRGVDTGPDVQSAGDAFRMLREVTDKSIREIWQEAKTNYDVYVRPDPTPVTDVEGNVVKARLLKFLEQAELVRPEYEAAYTKARGERIRRYDAIKGFLLKHGKWTPEIDAKLRAKHLSGPLFEKAPTFVPLYGEARPKELPVLFTPKDMNTLGRMIQQYRDFDRWDKLSTHVALSDLLSGKVPAPAALRDLRSVFGDEMVKELLNHKPGRMKALDELVAVVNIPRTLMSFMDMSAILRQGVVMTVAHPLVAAKAAIRSTRFVFSEKEFKDYFNHVLPQEELYPQMKRTKLGITDPYSQSLSQREEAFISRFVQQWPLVGRFVRASERAYVGYLTKLRADLFKDWVDVMRANNEIDINADPESPDGKTLKAVADVINTFTGRGPIHSGWAEPANAIFFSPRLITARLQALNPQWYAKLLFQNHSGSIKDGTFKLDPNSRRLAAKAVGDMMKFVSVGLLTLKLAKAAGAQVEMSPYSTDFGKIRVGNTRWDIWGGHQQYIRFLAQFIGGRTKNVDTGAIRTLTNLYAYRARTRYDVFMDFWGGKSSPPLSFGIEWAKNKSQGEPFNLSKAVLSRIFPLMLQDLREGAIDNGFVFDPHLRPLGVDIELGDVEKQLKTLPAIAIPSFFGVGTQTNPPWTPRTNSGMKLRL